MSALEPFMAYAAAFEETFLDDAWERLEPYFAENAVYDVESSLFGCHVEGRSAILTALKKSLDGFDRCMAGREIALREPPSESENRVELRWAVTYTKDGAPPFVLEGCSVVDYEDGRITRLTDSYTDAVSAGAAAWSREHAPDCTFSYV